MTENSFQFAIAISIVVLVSFSAIGLILAKLYRRASKQLSFVRTGFGGQFVIVDGGALVLPILHETIPVNMNTLRLEVERKDEQALITKDRMRVDVQAEFYIRVKPTEEAIADAAQTLGERTMDPEALKGLIEGKFVDALRSVAAEMAMEELHEQRAEFVQKVQTVVSEDLLKNGLELEAVSLTGLDQTSRKYFNPDNAFDAQGLTKLTEQIEARRKQRNDIEQETDLQIKQKNLEAEKKRLEVIREEEYAKMDQQREIEIRRAQQAMEIAKEQAERHRESEEASIGAKQKIEQAKIASEQNLKEQDVNRQKTIESAEIEKKKAVELAEQSRAIAIAEKSKEQSHAQKEANVAKAEAVAAEERVVTAREAEIAERQKRIELIQATKLAERDAIKLTIAADAGRKAAEDDAESMKIRASAQAESMKIEALGLEEKYKVEAFGKRAINEAENLLNSEQIALRIKSILIEKLPEILAESVKPLQQIEGIKIYQVDGLTRSSTGSGTNSSGNLAEDLVGSALRYRAQAPLIDSLLKDLGMEGGSLKGLTQAVQQDNNSPVDSEPKID
ncbi:MAG: flotillin family protein [Candidatus Cloacimonetes bacterium]|nr:flotillin family protein [Candidatus Cloacimonadota bacterium]